MEVGIERCSAEGRRKNLFDLILSVRNNSFSSKIFSSFHHLWELDEVFDNWIYFIDNQLVQEMLLQTTIWKRVGVECLVLISNYAKYLLEVLLMGEEYSHSLCCLFNHPSSSFHLFEKLVTQESNIFKFDSNCNDS